MRKNLIKGTIAIAAVAITASIIFATTTSSTYEPKIEKMEQEEIADWSNRNDSIFKKGEVVAIFEHYEYELNPNHRIPKMQAEICFIQVDNDPDNTINLIRYIHTMHSSSKIQVEFKDQYDRIKTWSQKID